MSNSTDALSRTAGAIQMVHALAERGAAPQRVESEVYATLTGWIGTRGAVPAIQALRDQLSLEIDVTRAELQSGNGEYAPGIRHRERLIVSLEAAQAATLSVLAEL